MRVRDWIWGNREKKGLYTVYLDFWQAGVAAGFGGWDKAKRGEVR